LQGTQSRHTKANLAKEPALCNAQATVCGATQTNIIDRHEEKGMRTTLGLALLGLDCYGLKKFIFIFFKQL